MYSENKSVLQLVSLLVAHRVRRAIVCAGSRSSPIAQSLAACPDIETFPCVDERSAAFEALGIMQVTGEPVAMCVTSGSALMDASPAVAEAYYQELPLILISADRPMAWIDQKDGQTMRQANALEHVVRCEVNLPSQDGPEEDWHRNRLINEALLKATGPVPGPVHINVPLAEPLFGFGATELPLERSVRVVRPAGFALPDELAGKWQESRRVLIVCGQMRPGTLDTKALAKLSGKAVLVMEHLANLDDLSASIDCADRADLAILEGGEKLQTFRPDLVISLGGHIVSKRFKKYLRSCPNLVHWLVSPNAELTDTYTHLETVLATEPNDFVKVLADLPLGATDRDFIHFWTMESRKIRTKLKSSPGDFADVHLVGTFLRNMPENACLHLANSSVVRHSQYWELPRGTRVFCNRGINGIDGSLSAALGNAEALEAYGTDVYCLIGDLSFFYDQNALWRTRLPKNLHVLLFNNKEGNIFRTLEGLASPYLRSHIAGANNLRAKDMCRGFGLHYACAENMDAFKRILRDFIKGPAPTLLEVVTDPVRDAQACKELNASLL